MQLDRNSSVFAPRRSPDDGLDGKERTNKPTRVQSEEKKKAWEEKEVNTVSLSGRTGRSK